MSKEDLSMDAFEFNEDDIGNLDDFITPDEEINPDEVVGDDDTDDDVTPSDEDKSGEDSDEDVDDKTNDDEDNDIKDNLYSSLAKVLYEEGVTTHLDIDNTKVDSVESLIEVIKNEVSSREFEDLNDNQKYYLEALRNGIPDESIKEVMQVEELIDSITEEDLESDESLRTNIIKQYYLARGIDENEADKLAKRSVDLAEDVEDAKSSLNVLKELSKASKEKLIEDAKNSKLEAQKLQQENLKTVKDTVTNIEKLIPSSKLDPKAKDELYKTITTPVAEINGQSVNEIFKYVNENPIEANIKLAYLYKITNGFTDFDTLMTKKATTKATRELENLLKNQQDPNIFGGGQSNDDNNYFGSNDEFDIIL